MYILDRPRSPINFLVIVSPYVPEPVDATAFPLWGPRKVVAGHICIIIVIVIVIAIPPRGFAFSLALRIRVLSGGGAADGGRSLPGCWRPKLVV